MPTIRVRYHGKLTARRLQFDAIELFRTNTFVQKILLEINQSTLHNIVPVEQFCYYLFVYHTPSCFTNRGNIKKELFLNHQIINFLSCKHQNILLFRACSRRPKVIYSYIHTLEFIVSGLYFIILYIRYEKQSMFFKYLFSSS